MKKRRLKLESKYILGIFTIGIICFIALGYVIYNRVSLMLINQCKTDAMGLAEVAARQIDGDSFDQISSSDDDAFYEAYRVLDHYSNNNLITYIYAMKPEGDHLIFVVDTDKDDPAECGEYYELIDDMKPALNGEVCCDNELSSDEWGTYFSAYAPIYNKSGEVTGFVGCDIILGDIEVMLEHLRLIIITFLSLFAIALVFSYIRVSEELMMRDSVTEISSIDKLFKFSEKLKKSDKLKNYAGVYINIKNFRYINQQIGIELGDVVLREYASFASKKLHKHELLVSMSGDAFFALILKDRVNEYLKQISPKDMKYALPKASTDTNNEDVNIIINIRAGIYPIENDSIREAMHKCSLALGETKKSNNDIVSFTSSMLEDMIAEKDILLSYSDAIKNEEFVVFYQPKVSSSTNELEGAEALCRWIRNGEIVPPNIFIPVLEENDKITELDFYIFEHVCRDIRSWIDRGITPVRISSNFSKNHLQNPEFAKKITDIVKKYNVPVEYLETELTESSGYSDNEALKKFLGDMQSENIFTSMDDFGTGYSSLSLLKELDFNVVKIDRAFFKDMNDGNKKNLKMIENVIRMIQDLDRIVVCEGIETVEQVDFLKAIGNPIIQGYLFDKPLPQAMFEKRLINPKYT